jgi:hypothetical protein
MILTDLLRDKFRQYVIDMADRRKGASTVTVLATYYEGCIAGLIDTINVIDPFFAEELLDLKIRLFQK